MKNRPALGVGIFLLLLSTLTCVIIVSSAYGEHLGTLILISTGSGFFGCTAGRVICLILALEDKGAVIGSIFLYLVVVVFWVIVVANFFVGTIDSEFSKWFLALGVFLCLGWGSTLLISAKGAKGALTSGIFHLLLALSCWILILGGTESKFSKGMVFSGVFVFTGSGVPLIVLARKFNQDETQSK